MVICKIIATMKNLFKSLMLVAVAAMAFTSCQNDIEEVNAVNKSVTLTFNAGFGEETRVDFAEAGNKAYKASWEAGDTVTFAVYEDASSDQPIEVAQPIEITEAANSVELTVSFNNLTVGNIIKAFVNYTAQNYGSSSYPWWVFNTSYNSQKPDANGPSEVYASASVEYAAGVDYADLTFAHDYAYGLMTLENLPFEVDYFELRVNGGNQPTSVELKNVTDNKVWFYVDEYEKVYDLEVRIVSKEDYNQQRYFVRSFGEADTFAFTKGRVSRFTIDTWYTKLTDPENVKGELNGEKIVFTWDEVENADSYDVVVEYNYEPTEYEVETNRLELDAENFDAFARLYVKVVAVGTGYVNSNSSSADFTVPIAKGAAGEQGYTFEYNKVEDLGQKKYKFYNDNENEYMYLTFETNLSELAVGEYVYSIGDGLVASGYSENAEYSEFSLPNLDNNYLGREYWFQDGNAVFVDVKADGNISVIAFCKRWIGNGDHLFKGSFNGTLTVKETLATPANLEAEVDGYSVTLSWGKVDGATSYEVNFAGKTEEVTTTSAKFEGVAVGYYSATVVAKAEGYNDSEAARLDNIQVKQVFETVEIESVVAGAVDGNYTPLTLTTVKGDVITTKAGNAGVNYLNEGTWDYNNWYDSGYALGNVFLNGDTWVSTFVMEVKHVEGKYELTIESSVGNFHFLGDITGLVVPGYEPEVPDGGDVVATSAVARYDSNHGYCTIVDFQLPYGLVATVVFRTGAGNWDSTNYFTRGLDYINAGVWTTYQNAEGDEWYTYAYLSGEDATINGNIAVTYYETYSFTFTINDYNVTYTGNVGGLVAPKVTGDGPVVEEAPEFTIPGEGVYDYEFRYTKLVDGLDANNAIRVKQDDGLMWDIRFNSNLTEIEPGDYEVKASPSGTEKAIDNYWSAFENGASYNWVYYDGVSSHSLFNVQKNGNFYCITSILTYNGSTYRLVYIGKIENN